LVADRFTTETRGTNVHIGEQLVDRLIGYGVRRVFGCPGGQTLPLYNGIFRRHREIEHVLMRDERSAAYAADAYARATGRLGVCDATVGPGASNLVSGLVEASSASIPVMAIVSDIPRTWEHRRHLGSASQAFEQRRFLEGCTKWYGRVDTPDNLAEILQSCVRIATSGRPGPVVLEIPDDVFAGPASPDPFPTSSAWARFPRLRAAPDPVALELALARLRASRKPMIVVGGGALYAEAGACVLELAELLACPVATTVTGKGTISELHTLSVSVAGRFGVPMANTCLAEADCVVFIGTKAGQTTTNGWTLPSLDTPVIHIDIDPDEIGRSYRDSVGLLADAQLGTAALFHGLQASPPRTSWDAPMIAELRRAWWDGPIQYRQAPEPGILKPQELVRRLRGLMADADTLVCDASLASGWGASRWRMLTQGHRYFAPRGLAGLGWGLPAAIGVSLAQRDLGDSGRVVCLAGDGGWGYSMADVETATRVGLPILTLLLNNSTLGWIKHTAAGRYPGEMVSEDFAPGVNYAEGAHGLGAEVARVDNMQDFEAALRSALSDRTPRPWLIEACSCDIETPVLQAHAPARTVGGY
jgi:acetolactate synthase-1/2/3 large subunit